MKLGAQDEYGLRCLLQIARLGEDASMTIPEISRAEGLTPEYVAKIMRILRQGDLVTSTRGQAGGYTLARPADQITVSETLSVLGGPLFESGFCTRYSGSEKSCTHSTDCSIRSLWRAVQIAVDQVLSQTTLKDLLLNEEEMINQINGLVQITDSNAEMAGTSGRTANRI